MTELDDLEEGVAGLGAEAAGARAEIAALGADMAQMRQSLALTGREVATLSRSIGRGLRGAFDGLVFDGLRLSDALEKVANSVVDAAYSAAISPVQKELGGALARGVAGVMSGISPFADGAGFAQGRVMPFASGGIVRQATTFPMRGGRTGLMGEAGPEAIMPLARGADGRLGVRAQGAGGGARAVNVSINVSSPDAESFRRSRSQIAAELGRAIARGGRNR